MGAAVWWAAMTDGDPLAPLWLLVGLLAASVAVAILDAPLGLPVVGRPGRRRVRDRAHRAVRLRVDDAARQPRPAPRDRPARPRVRSGVPDERRRPATDGRRHLLLAIPGVVIVAGIVALILTVTTVLTPTEAFVVGAMVAATDPAAVLATFRQVRVPDRLATTVEMESLVNDGTGIVLFALALDLLAGHGSLGGAALEFVVSVWAAASSARSWAGPRRAWSSESTITSIELTVTIVLAYGTYLIAATLGGSGVIATLVAAGVFGHLARGALSDRATETIDVVWELVAFLLTAAVFLLVGVSLAPGTLVHAVGPIGWGILAILVARAVVVYGLLGGATRLFRGRGGDRDPIGRPARRSRSPGSTSSSGPGFAAPSRWRSPCRSRPIWRTATCSRGSRSGSCCSRCSSRARPSRGSSGDPVRARVRPRRSRRPERAASGSRSRGPATKRLWISAGGTIPGDPGRRPVALCRRPAFRSRTSISSR